MNRRREGRLSKRAREGRRERGREGSTEGGGGRVEGVEGIKRGNELFVFCGGASV